jgi:hypothetical protein
MMKEKTYVAAFARGECETPCHPEIDRRVIRQFGNGRHRCAALQRFLHGPENVANARNAENENALCRKADKIETGAIELAAPGGIILLNPKYLLVAAAQRGKRERESRGRAEVKWHRRKQFVQKPER